MPQLAVIPVESGRHKKQFLDLPWTIYRDDPYWIPPLRMNVKELVGFSAHPFHDNNRVRNFLAVRDGIPVGRISAIVNQAHIDRYHDPRGFFGFFECMDDEEVSTALFAAAKDWLADQGLHNVRGPANPTLNYECGLLIDGFDSSPYFMMTYNRPYYARLVENFGFRKVQDMYAFWGHVGMLKELDSKLAFVVEESSRRFQFQMRSLDRRRFDSDVRAFLDLYNQSLGGTWGFTPMSEGEVTHMAKALKMLIVPELTSIAEVDGRIVGAAFALLDYNPRIKAIDGRLFPFGFARLLWNKRAIKKLRFISTNVAPEFQKWGLGLVLLHNLVAPVLQWGIQEAEFSWVLESNTLSAGSLRRGGAKLTKTYRMYDYGPTPDPQRDLYEGKTRRVRPDRSSTSSSG